MSIKLSRALNDQLSASGVARTVRDYERRFKEGKSGALEGEGSGHRRFNDLYYNLVTDFLSSVGAGLFTSRHGCRVKVSRNR